MALGLIANHKTAIKWRYFSLWQKRTSFFSTFTSTLTSAFSSRLGEGSQLILAGSTNAIFPLCDTFRVISGRRSTISLHRLGVMRGYSSRGNILFRLTLYLCSVSAFVNFRI